MSALPVREFSWARRRLGEGLRVCIRSRVRRTAAMDPCRRDGAGAGTLPAETGAAQRTNGAQGLAGSLHLPGCLFCCSFLPLGGSELVRKEVRQGPGSYLGGLVGPLLSVEVGEPCGPR
ncbi:hypothetical protein NDU88_001493 [Pleurodeles waltl]|uniref:Uncharacterized protein n=1 Tax=Pleurodeles waltl TaxID=8319 RepID=A0AAV7WMU6_PLEWA|nr:hypothetical protein NDU88_001493 [Pleurodeles waltl]